MANRLANETSPYLLQHKDNPVDWYPWGQEAFDKAKSENKPIFLSVGYSSCHWCHVMEHESFEDVGVAELLNKDFVAVKVDREERPDVDEAYMTAVQLSSGRGGWPMSVFMTPDGDPFFAGTYFPREDREGYPGFKNILSQLAMAWKTKRDDLEQAGLEFRKALTQSLTAKAPGTFDEINPDFIANAIKASAAQFDRENGGSQGAPKFPPHSNTELMLSYALWEDAQPELREAALAMGLVTLEKMCLGGIHDHVGGGFHRYSTDEKWLLPHFEKMLYDNALMLGNLARGSAIAGQIDPRLEELFARTAHGIVYWLAREMRSPEGLFYSALDADSEGEEGKFYVWTEAEIREALGDRAQVFIDAYGIKPEGNFQDEATKELTGGNIPHLSEDRAGQFEEELEMLQKARDSRVKPGLDDKALVGWNGLTIKALTEVGAIPLAEACALAILAAEKQLGSLPHQIAKGKASGAAFLEDYAFLIQGLMVLAATRIFAEQDPQIAPALNPATTGRFWKDQADRLLAEMVEKFYDAEAGGFFSTSSGHEELFGRTKPSFDQPIPSANSFAIRCLLDAGDVARAGESLSALKGWMQRAPGATEGLYTAALELLMETADETVIPISEPAAKPEQPAEIKVLIEGKELRAGSDGKATGKVLIEIPEGLHLNSPEPPARWLVPTRIEVKPVKAEIHYPPSEADRYEGRLEIPFTLTLPEKEDGSDYELLVSFQACTETECQLPQEKSFNGVIFR
jgi:uncharacterized protein YyaL (SSP411 family)